MPAGARCTPGFLTRPLTENERSPFRPWRPWPANQAGPFSRMSRTQCSVSMLCSSVGRPNRPTCATYGGRRRGSPRLPSIDSIIADSSPQMYAPAPRRRWIAGMRVRRIRLQRRDLALEDRAAAVILVAQVDVDRVDADRPRRDQRAFEKAVRIALEVVAVLERARLALVDVDRQQARRRLGRHQSSICGRQGSRRRRGRAGPSLPSPR